TWTASSTRITLSPLSRSRSRNGSEATIPSAAFSSTCEGIPSSCSSQYCTPHTSTPTDLTMGSSRRSSSCRVTPRNRSVTGPHWLARYATARSRVCSSRGASLVTSTTTPSGPIATVGTDSAIAHHTFRGCAFDPQRLLRPLPGTADRHSGVEPPSKAPSLYIRRPNKADQALAARQLYRRQTPPLT